MALACWFRRRSNPGKRPSRMHQVVFLENFFDDLRYRIPLGKVAFQPGDVGQPGSQVIVNERSFMV
jgi:hypothetical protein